MAELREETGLRAGKLVRVGHLFEAYGFCNQGYHLYVALDLEHGQAEREETESDMVSRGFTVAQVRHMIASGEIKDATTIAAFGFLILATDFSGFFD